jgi:hypothetical protein
MPKERHRRPPDAAILRLREENWLPEIAKRLELSRQATSKWRRVPSERVRKVAEITGYPLHFLRPDLYEVPTGPASRRRNHRLAAHA